MLIYDVRQVIFKGLQRDRLIFNKNKLEETLRLQKLDDSRWSSFTTGVPFCTICHRRHSSGVTFTYSPDDFHHFCSTNQKIENILIKYETVWNFLKLSISFGGESPCSSADLYNLFHRYDNHERKSSTKIGRFQFRIILRYLINFINFINFIRDILTLQSVEGFKIGVEAFIRIERHTTSYGRRNFSTRENIEFTSEQCAFIGEILDWKRRSEISLRSKGSVDMFSGPKLKKFDHRLRRFY